MEKVISATIRIFSFRLMCIEIYQFLQVLVKFLWIFCFCSKFCYWYWFVCASFWCAVCLKKKRLRILINFLVTYIVWKAFKPSLVLQIFISSRYVIFFITHSLETPAELCKWRIPPFGTFLITSNIGSLSIKCFAWKKCIDGAFLFVSRVLFFENV